MVVSLPSCGDKDHRPSCPPTFDSGLWRAAQRADIYLTVEAPSEIARRVSAADLVRCKRLRGLTKGQVTRLLGKPIDSTPVTYPVGYREGVTSGAEEYLVVAFDPRGKVSFVQAPDGTSRDRDADTVEWGKRPPG